MKTNEDRLKEAEEVKVISLRRSELMDSFAVTVSISAPRLLLCSKEFSNSL